MINEIKQRYAVWAVINKLKSKFTTNIPTYWTAFVQLYTHYFTFSHEIAVGSITLSLCLQLFNKLLAADTFLRGSSGEMKTVLYPSISFKRFAFLNIWYTMSEFFTLNLMGRCLSRWCCPILRQSIHWSFFPSMSKISETFDSTFSFQLSRK